MTSLFSQNFFKISSNFWKSILKISLVFANLYVSLGCSRSHEPSLAFEADFRNLLPANSEYKFWLGGLRLIQSSEILSRNKASPGQKLSFEVPVGSVTTQMAFYATDASNEGDCNLSEPSLYANFSQQNLLITTSPQSLNLAMGKWQKEELVSIGIEFIGAFPDNPSIELLEPFSFEAWKFPCQSGTWTKKIGKGKYTILAPTGLVKSGLAVRINQIPITFSTGKNTADLNNPVAPTVLQISSLDKTYSATIKVLKDTNDFDEDGIPDNQEISQKGNPLAPLTASFIGAETLSLTYLKKNSIKKIECSFPNLPSVRHFASVVQWKSSDKVIFSEKLDKGLRRGTLLLDTFQDQLTEGDVLTCDWSLIDGENSFVFGEKSIKIEKEMLAEEGGLLLAWVSAASLDTQCKLSAPASVTYDSGTLKSTTGKIVFSDSQVFNLNPSETGFAEAIEPTASGLAVLTLEAESANSSKSLSISKSLNLILTSPSELAELEAAKAGQQVPFKGCGLTCLGERGEMGTGNHSCSLSNSQALQCWGKGTERQLGQGSTASSNSPVSVGFALLAEEKWRALAIGSSHTCAGTSAGRLICFGDNSQGQLGLGATTASENPTLNLLTNSESIEFGGLDAGAQFTCGLKKDQSVWCFGLNNLGQIGLGNTTNTNVSTPSLVTGLTLSSGEKIIDLSSGTAHTCALSSESVLKCWGSNSNGQLGINPALSSFESSPALVNLSLGTKEKATHVSAGDAHTCVVFDSGRVRCFGRNNAMQLGGDSSGANVFDGVDLVLSLGTGGAVVRIVSGAEHNCVLLNNQRVHCWGSDQSGELGNGPTDTFDQALPGQVLNLTNAVALSASAHSPTNCVLNSNGQIDCWGANNLGQMGKGNTSAAEASVVSGPSSAFQALANCTRWTLSEP